MRIAFTLILAAFFIQLSAQDLTLNQTEWDLPLGEVIDYGEITLTNNGSSTVDIAITLESICYSEDDAAAIQVCVGDLCFKPVTMTTTWGDTENPADILISLAPGESNTTLKFDPFFDSEDTGSEWNVVFFEIGNPENNVSLNVKLGGECMPVSTNNLVQLEESAFPNPATSFLNIPSEGFGNGTCMIFNSIGTLQETISLERLEGNFTVDVSQYANGVYFYQFTDGEEVSNARSFIKH